MRFLFLLLFFSSRRRHTSSYGDWSSDVCSSDLIVRLSSSWWTSSAARCCCSSRSSRCSCRSTRRSEERRVGKEFLHSLTTLDRIRQNLQDGLLRAAQLGRTYHLHGFGNLLRGDDRCDSYSYFFFFQAEDGIRVRTVTGVQTCALPISSCG